MGYLQSTIFVILFVSMSHTGSQAASCGSSSDVTNIGVSSNAVKALAVNSFNDLNSKCYGDTKKTLQQLQMAVKEGEKCQQSVTVIQDKLGLFCSIIQPLRGFSRKFEKSLKMLKLIHSSLSKMTKFAETLPAVGKIRKLIVEKVLPLALKVLEFLNKQVVKVIEYMEKILGYKDKKSFLKLVWEVDKKGSKVCKLGSQAGKSLELVKSASKKFNGFANVTLQSFFETKSCINHYCVSRGEDRCSECSVFDNHIGSNHNLITSWKDNMESCHKKLDKAIEQINKLISLKKLFKIAEKIMNEIEKFLLPISNSLKKAAESFGPVMKNLLSCCPCGRPNPIGCIAETVTNVVNLVTCPLDGMMNFQMDNFLRSLKAYIHQLVFGNFPTINIEISLPVAHFEISLPKFVQDCLGKSSFTKFCSLLDKPLKITFGSLIAAENVKQPSFAERGVSLSNQIKASCMGALGEFKKFGKKMSTCFDSPDDFFFLIPPVGFIAALTCDPNYSDPDPGINYCPCEVPDLTQEKEKQPYCVIWHRSWHRTCASLCRDKKYVPGKKPSGGTGKMHKTFGYPRCEKLEYYCRKSNINIKNGQASCSSDYTIYGSTCRITPNPGYICPVTVIECGSEGDPSKGVCWNYRFIKCAMNDKRHFPMCTCPNKNTFQKGEVVCQSGSANGIALKNVLEMRRSVSCFKPLGLEGDILKECGPSTNPCVVQQPNVEAYQRCGLTKVQKFWEKYGKELLGGGIVAILVAVALLVGLCKAYASDNIDTSCSFLSIMIIAILVFLTAGIVMLVFKSKFRTYEDDDDNYLTMGEALF